jgi:DNA helicase-4
MAWKRTTHAKFGTRLIQLYQYQRNEGSLISELDRALQEHGIQGEELDERTVLRVVGAPDAANSFTALVKAFLVQFKSNDSSFAELSRRGARFKGLEAERARAFVTVFQGSYDRYQQELAAEGAIDFSDRITEAAAAIRRGTYSPKWQHIIVDEFQDISVGRYRLLDQLLRAPTRPRLFAVGDDWQSINRFAGSELTIMTEADRYFRSPTVMFLRDTFRFGQNLADVSSEFVTRNPGQLRKRVQGTKDAGKPVVSLWWTNSEDSKALLRLVERMAKRVPPRSSLLVLARYNKLLPRHWVQRELANQWTSGTLAFSTVHAAKGLEADYVVLLGVRGEMPRAENGYLSIPSAQSDDSLLELVMPEPETFEHAEERRLFYVALTRAKRHVALLCNPTFPSVFATELAANGKVATRGHPYVDIPCPKCQAARRRGTLRWQNGTYQRCDHARCSFMIRRCACGSGYMVPGEREARLHCTDAMCEVGQTH